MEEFSRANTVHELKCEIQFSHGLPVSSFTLYFGIAIYIHLIQDTGISCRQLYMR